MRVEENSNALQGWRSLAVLTIALLVLTASGALLKAIGVRTAPLTGNQGSMERYLALREIVAREGMDDVVTIGSSIFLKAVMPQAVAEGLAEGGGLGRPARVFNFGAAGHGVLTYPTLVELLLGLERPQVIVLLVTPRAIDLTAKRIILFTGIVAESPYARALHDPWPARGRLRRALLDHWPLNRYGPTLRALLVGESDSWRAAPELHTGRGGRGYIQATRVRTHQFLLDRQREAVAQWETSPAFSTALESAVASARAGGSRVLLVDAPLRDALLDIMEDPERNVGGTRRFMQEAAEQLGVAIAFAPPNLLRDEDFADLVHYVPSGAKIYSRWLGAEIRRQFPDLRFQ